MGQCGKHPRSRGLKVDFSWFEANAMFPLPWRRSMLIVVRTCDGVTHGSGIALASSKLSANRFRMRGFSTDSICGAISGIYTCLPRLREPDSASFLSIKEFQYLAKSLL